MLSPELPNNNLVHAVAALVLIGRLGDIGSTYFVTPTLALEANPVVRRLGWSFAAASLLLCLVPYYHVGLGLMAAVTSLMVAGSNLSRAWVSRALGEKETLAMLRVAAGRIPRWKAIASVVVGACFVALAAGVLILTSGGSKAGAFWFALGLLIYAAAIALYGVLFVLRIYRL